MVNLFGSFSKIKRQKVLLIGDLMLDKYTIGKVGRISPEAPVPVLLVHKEECRPGGAGNAALNLISMGSNVTLLGRIGSDESGQTLKQALLDDSVDVSGIFVQANFPTPVKNRVVANNQQIVRIDHEQVVPLQEMLEQQMITALPELAKGAAVIAISDYGKGLITPTLMAAIIEQARKQQIQVITDPKGFDFSKYRGTDVIKPNLSEVYAAANMPSGASLDVAAARVLEITQANTLMITRSEAGISLFYKNGTRQDFPVRKQVVINDVTGAGDTVLAVIACALANGLSMPEGSQLGNIAAGIAIEQFGCARVTLSQLAQRLLSDDVGNKVFDQDHLDVLREALTGRDYVVFTISSEAIMNAVVFRAIHQIAHQRHWDLLVYVQEGGNDNEMISVLSSLHDVDYVITKEETLRALCALTKPAEFFEIIDGKPVSIAIHAKQ